MARSFRIDTDRLKGMIASLTSGQPIAPGKNGWGRDDVLVLAGACSLFVDGARAARKRGTAGLLAGDSPRRDVKQFASELLLALELCSQAAASLLRGDEQLEREGIVRTRVEVLPGQRRGPGARKPRGTPPRAQPRTRRARVAA